MEPSSSTTAETPLAIDAPSKSYPNPTLPSPTIVLHPRREPFEHGLLPIPKLIFTDGTLTLTSIKQKLLNTATKPSQITSSVLAEVVDIPIDQAVLVIDTLVSVLPQLSPQPTDEDEEGVVDVNDLMLFLYIQSYKRLLTRTHKDSATVTDVWPSTSVFDGVLSTLSPLQVRISVIFVFLEYFVLFCLRFFWYPVLITYSSSQLFI